MTITPRRLQQLQRTSTATVENVFQLRAPQSLPVVEQNSQLTLEDPAAISTQIRIGPQAEALINTNINFPLKENIVSGPNTLQMATRVLGSFIERVFLWYYQLVWLETTSQGFFPGRNLLSSYLFLSKVH